MTHLRGHLGPNISAVVDGQLDHNDRDRALAHVMHCPDCRAAVDDERSAKAALAHLRDPLPSSALIASLLSLPGPVGPLPPDLPSFGGARPTPAPWRPMTPSPSGSARSSRRPGPSRGFGPATRQPRVIPHRVQLFAAGAFSAVAVTLGLAALGAEQQPAPAPASIVPPVSDFTVEHARSTGQLPFTGPAVVFEPVGSGGVVYPQSPQSGRP